MRITRSRTLLLNLVGLLIVLNVTGCANNSTIPVAVQCPASPSAPTCLVTKPAQTEFLPQFQSMSKELDRLLNNANQQLVNSENKLQGSLNGPKATPPR